MEVFNFRDARGAGDFPVRIAKVIPPEQRPLAGDIQVKAGWFVL
jgi:hypothetical protein